MSHQIAEAAEEELVKTDALKEQATVPDEKDPSYEAWVTAGILEVLVSPKLPVSVQVAMARAARILVSYVVSRQPAGPPP